MRETALLVIDMINTYRHADAQKLAPNVAEIIDPLAGLVTRAGSHDDIDVIYVNDNYGDFTADHTDIIRSALEGERPDLVKPIMPDPGSQLDTERVIVAGQVTEQCILYTALDAYIRDFAVVVPPDAVAHIDAALGDAALKMMQRNMKATIAPAGECLR